MKRITGRIDEFLEWGGRTKSITVLAVSAAALLSVITGLLPAHVCWVTIVLCGTPILLEALIGLVTSFDIKADVLVAVALVASICIGELEAAAEVALIMQLGELLEDITVDKARAGIEQLIAMTPKTAHLVTDGTEQIIPAEDVQAGNLLRVLPGETVPVDGVIESGRTSINEAAMTGESLPAEKSEGDEVSGGTVNQFGAFTMRATRVGEDSALQRMISLMESADAGKAKTVRLADRWATWIVSAALCAALLAWLLTGDVVRGVTVLVVFCPCSLVLATPTAMTAAMGNAAKHGFLVREGDALERLSRVNTVTFDKTGTLTEGSLSVAAVLPKNGMDEKTLYTLTAGAESLSEHPLGKAIRGGYRTDTGEKEPEAGNFSMIPGRGVRAVVNGRNIMAGNATMLEEGGVACTESNQQRIWQDRGASMVHVAVDGVYAGCIALTDTVRKDSEKTVAQLNGQGIETVLLTGDNEKAAGSVAEGLGISRVLAHCLPEDKLNHVKAMTEKGRRVCMIGDGINDAPALKAADVGIAMGGIGSDAAVEAADIVLVNDGICGLPKLFELARKMMKTVKVNIIFAMALNFVAVALAMTGCLTPLAGALVHNAGSVLVIGRSAMLLGQK